MPILIDDTQILGFTAILKEELIPAMGCTEPIAIALAAAHACTLLDGEPFLRLRVGCSGNIIKNVKSVIIPGTQSLFGVEAAAVAGAVAGDYSAGLQVLAKVTDEQKAEITREYHQKDCQTYYLRSPHTLHIRVEAWSEHHASIVEVQDRHDNCVYACADEVVILDAREQSRTGDSSATAIFRDQLCLALIKEYADTVDLSLVRPILSQQIEFNMAIAREGLNRKYGVNYSDVILARQPTVYEKMEAWASAASEARMSGCELPVVINSGSGNQGISSSVPGIVYCREKGYSDEQLLRMLCFSNLLTIYQKHYIGKLSAFCGAISATCSSGAALTYIEGGTLEQISHTITNTLAVTAGIICDGAKPSCGAKIATGLHAAIYAHQLATVGRAYSVGDGIVCHDADATIRGIGHIAREGMATTDVQIMDVMLST